MHKHKNECEHWLYVFAMATEFWVSNNWHFQSLCLQVLNQLILYHLLLFRYFKTSICMLSASVDLISLPLFKHSRCLNQHAFPIGWSYFISIVQTLLDISISTLSQLVDLISLPLFRHPQCLNLHALLIGWSHFISIVHIPSSPWSACYSQPKALNSLIII